MEKQKTPAIYKCRFFDETKLDWVNEDREIYIGMPCCYNVGSDIHPAYVSRVSDSGKTVWIKDAIAEPDEENNYDYFSNQVYKYSPNENASEKRINLRKTGRWHYTDYSTVTFGLIRKYHDPHF